MIIESFEQLDVYKMAFSIQQEIFELSRQFPKEERYALTDQIRRSSRSVGANIAEAWRKRRYEKHFCSTMNIAEAEAAKEEDSHGGEESHDTFDRLQQCTTLVEPGGAQLITLLLPEPSFSPSNDDEAFRFFVPGTDAELEVMVP